MADIMIYDESGCGSGIGFATSAASEAPGHTDLMVSPEEINTFLAENPPQQDPAPAILNAMARVCHAANEKWWQNPETGERITRNKGELLMLIVSEVAEAMEGERKGLMDDKLPRRSMAEVELVDALIRIFDYAGAYGYDLDGAFAEKMAFNAQRADHKHEARLAVGGKKW